MELENNVKFFGAENWENLILALKQLVCGPSNHSSIVGLKNSRFNRLALPRGHKSFYDDSSNRIFVPILTFVENMSWTPNTMYSVMVVAKDVASYKALVTKDYNQSLGLLECSEDNIKQHLL